MSVFSRIRRGRLAAKEHAQKKAELHKAEAAKTPYKHVPRHAAVDAMSGAPATWREEDRPKILEQNRRRSAMTASGVGMSGMVTPVHMGFPRTNSALSHVSYPAVHASPVVQVPRAYSHHSMYPGWNNNGGEVVYSQVSPGGGSLKGKEVERVVVVEPAHSGQSSRSSSKGSTGKIGVDTGMFNIVKPHRTSPIGSSSDSTSSQDDLEMKPVKHVTKPTSILKVPSAPPTPLAHPTPQFMQSPAQVDYFHRPHMGHARRTSDPPVPIQSLPPQVSHKTQKPSRITSLPSSPTGIPPVPALPPMSFEFPSAQYSTSSVTPSSSAGTGLSSTWSSSTINAAHQSASSSSSSLSKTASTVRAVTWGSASGASGELQAGAGIASAPFASQEQYRLPPKRHARFSEAEAPQAQDSPSTTRSYYPPTTNNSFHRDGHRQEMQRHESQRREIQRQESHRQDLQRHESQRQEFQWQESQRQEMHQQESRRQEGSRQSSRQESHHSMNGHPDGFKQEYYFRAGSLRRDSYRQQENLSGPDEYQYSPSSRRDSLRQDSYRPEPARQDSYQQQARQAYQPAAMPVSALPTQFDLPSHGNMNVASLEQKGGKLTKNRDNNPKLVKKNRWSFRSSNAQAVAV